ncbi:MAG: nicotinate phosphoribosyltransferase [Candidatus Kerfeldbacteria bacterium]
MPGFGLEHQFGVGTIFFNEGMEHLIATCDLLIRDAPKRNFLVTGGLEAIIGFIKNLRYDEALIKHLLDAKQINKKFADYLRNFSFSGDIDALPEGTVHFPGEPIVRVTAPIIEANLITDQLIALSNIDTLLLSKLARVRIAAKDIRCGVGFVRAQGIDAGWRAGRNALFFDHMGFSNAVTAMRMNLVSEASTFNANHAFVKSFNTELEAFRASVRHFPDIISPMVDTYGIEQGVANVITVAHEMKQRGKHLKDVTVDSGDLLKNAMYVRKKLDEAGHTQTTISVASNLDEYKISRLIEQGIPADIFLVVTEVVTSADAPKLETVYKLAQIEDGNTIRYTAKFSANKVSLPGKKQVFRIVKDGLIEKDIIGLENEDLGTPLLVPVFRKGKLVYRLPSIEKRRQYTMGQLSLLPEQLKDIFHEHPAPLEISKKVTDLLERLRSQHVQS